MATPTSGGAPVAPKSSYLPHLAQSYQNFRSGGPKDCFVQETYINRTKWESQCYISVPPNAIQQPATQWLEYCCTSGQAGNIFEKIDGCGWQCITNRTLEVGAWWKDCIWDDRSPLLTGYNLNLTGYEAPMCENRKTLEKTSAGNNARRISSRVVVLFALVVPLVFM
ncbi:hypothetical protein TWF730_007523 [Orbilia blumenaviensis]|uniref:Transmembrane protein n=1 Tax=Orbilia blumenaviensis TaxID=1796055 RepID=A0AAV9V831_9PEZI